jgi:hypothetical protein
MKTIDEAKQYLRQNAYKKGARCPCCHQFTKVYRRQITGTMSRALILLAKEQWSHAGEPFIHVNNLLTEHKLLCSDWSKFQYWNLIEPLNAGRDDGSSRNGQWRMTHKGFEFVRNETAIPKWVETYNSKVLKFSTELTTIRATFNVAFDYDAMMNI